MRLAIGQLTEKRAIKNPSEAMLGGVNRCFASSESRLVSQPSCVGSQGSSGSGCQIELPCHDELQRLTQSNFQILYRPFKQVCDVCQVDRDENPVPIEFYNKWAQSLAYI